MFTFDEQLAAEYGLDVVIFCSKIADWLKWNKANNKNFHDGKYWTYNSLKALTRLFPFWTIDQLRKVIKDCMDAALIVKGKYNKSGYDQTLWYSLTEKGCEAFKIPTWENPHVNEGNSTDGSGEKPAPIPIKSNQQNKTNKSFCASHETEKPKAVDNLKHDNQKKHDWAQMKNEQFHVKQNEEFKRAKPPEQLSEILKKLKMRAMVGFSGLGGDLSMAIT